MSLALLVIAAVAVVNAPRCEPPCPASRPCWSRGWARR